MGIIGILAYQNNISCVCVEKLEITDYSWSNNHSQLYSQNILQMSLFIYFFGYHDLFLLPFFLEKETGQENCRRKYTVYGIY